MGNRKSLATGTLFPPETETRADAPPQPERRGKQTGPFSQPAAPPAASLESVKFSSSPRQTCGGCPARTPNPGHEGSVPWLSAELGSSVRRLKGLKDVPKQKGPGFARRCLFHPSTQPVHCPQAVRAPLPHLIAGQPLTVYLMLLPTAAAPSHPTPLEVNDWGQEGSLGLSSFALLWGLAL